MVGKAESDRLVVDDFEGEVRWKPVSWSNANDSDLSPGETDDGMLRVNGRPGKQEKAAIQLKFPRSRDLTGFDYIAVKAKVEQREGEKPVDLAVGFQTTAYFESTRLPVGQQITPELRISLSRKDYKTSPEWEYNSPLGDRASVGSMYLLFYYEQRCRVAIDEIYLGREEAEHDPPAEESAASPPMREAETDPPDGSPDED